MSEMMIIVKREFLERVRSRSFLIGTILFPLLIAALMILPTLMGGGGSTRELLLVDEAPPGVGDRLIQAINAPPKSTRDNSYRVERVSGTLAELRPELNRRVREKEIDGYLALPTDVLESGEVLYRARSISSLTVMRDLRMAASSAAQAERLRQAGLDGGKVASLIRPVDINGARVTKRGEEQGSAISAFFFAYLVTMLIYFMTVFYGVNVMRSVLEEKTNRIAEVMVSSVRPAHLMAGKIFGVGSAAVLQVLIWAVIVTAIGLQGDLLAKRFNMPPDALRALAVEPGVGLALFTFFLLGFFLYSALFAALGAAVTSEQEAQSLQMVVLLPLIVPLMFIGAITNDPLGKAATWLGLVPLTSPLAMPMRMASSPLPAMQVIGSIVLLVLGLAAVAWVAGKIYRIGILSTGKRPTLKELGKWLRAA